MINKENILKESEVREVKVMEKELKKEFKETYKTKQEKEESEWREKMGDNIKYVDMLKDTYYSFDMEGLKVMKIEKGYPYLVSNALIIPTKKIDICNESNKTCLIELKAILNTGEVLQTIQIPIQDIEKNNFYTNEEWGLKIIFDETSSKLDQKQCIKLLAKKIKGEEIFGFTGFYQINDNNIFLHSGGALGTNKHIDVDLGNDALHRYRFTDKEFNIVETIKISLECLKIAPEKITLPILALNFLAPLITIFDDIKIPIGFLTYVLGPQQTKKTSIVCAITSHFGNFDKNHIVLNFLDTIPSVINKCEKLKDVVVICDDNFPSSNKTEASHMKSLTENIISLSADRMVGSRSKSNGEVRKKNKQRCLIIATGEIFPELSQSRLSRVLFINIAKNEVKCKELTYIQNHQEELQYSMKKYIEYIIYNMENIGDEVKATFSKKIEEANKEITLRTGEMITSLYVAYSIFLDFALNNNAITEKEKQNELEKAWQTLLQVGKEQNEIVEKSSPTTMLLSAIEGLNATKKLFVVDMKSSPYMKQKEIYKQEFIGFYDEERKTNFIYPDILYKKVRNFYSQQGIDFPFNKSTIWKELMTNGLLYKTEKQERPQIRIKNPITTREETAIGILADKVYIPCIYNEGGTIKEK